MKKMIWVLLLLLVACNSQPENSNPGGDPSKESPSPKFSPSNPGGGEASGPTEIRGSFQEVEFQVRVDGVEIPVRTDSWGNLRVQSLPGRIQGKFDLIREGGNIIFFSSDPNSRVITDEMCEKARSWALFAEENKNSEFYRRMAQDRRQQVRRENHIRISLYPVQMMQAQVYIDAARAQGIAIHSAPQVSGLPEVNEMRVQVSFREGAVSNILGETQEFEEQFQAMGFRGTYRFDHYDADLSSADLICDLRSGHAVLTMELRGTYFGLSQMHCMSQIKKVSIERKIFN